MYHNFINNSLISFEKFNFFNIFSSNDVSMFYKSIDCIKSAKDLIYHYKRFGAQNIEDILDIYLGKEEFLKFKKTIYCDKYKLISKYCHPYSFKVLNWTSKNKFKKVHHINRNKIIEDYMIVENSDNCECYDIKRTSQNFWLRIYGIKVIFQLPQEKQTLVFYCICDDILIEQNIQLKDYLIYDKDELLQNKEYQEKILENYNNEFIDTIIKDFMNVDIFYKRNILIDFLSVDDEKYLSIALLLYDLLNNRRKSYEYNSEKKMISLTIPNHLKKKLLNSSKDDINKIYDGKKNIDIDIPLETRIKMLNVDDFVKSKLTMKLKELKSKGDDNGKIRQYLDGILNVPFGVFVKEEVFKISQEIKEKVGVSIVEFIYNYNDLLEKHKKKYDVLINKTVPLLLKKKKKRELIIANDKYKYLNKTRIIENILNDLKHYTSRETVNELLYFYGINTKTADEYFDTCDMKCSIETIKDYIIETKLILDKSIYAHDNVKRDIQRIFTRWITGETDGYCIGFEGPPGVGKTTLAKYGISQCLRDNKQNVRPFNFLSLGGSNNSNLLDGHNYTYVGSTWGKLVDFLMKSKCMNPIIYIDELDKVSKTEHGNEIIGILTHLTDPSQNQHISDKYFSGIPFDFSKVLFIFSYNDPSLIDPILLDRIHRVKFNFLKEKDKLIIANDYIIPDIFKKIGLNKNIVSITNENILYLIRKFTNEPGVRKLKELLFVILSEINIKLIGKEFDNLPLCVTNDELKLIYLKDKYCVIDYKINNENDIYGLWANSLGMGGVLPINIKEFHTKTPLELKLTGLPGTVMKESMHVSQTLSWNNLNKEEKELWLNKDKGIHIHCPDGSTNKDGPSAGSALTLSLILFFKNLKPNNSYGITGEINLDGEITAIGGLELKINGGIKAGLRHFIFPKQNIPDFEKIEDKSNFKDVTFYQVGNLNELLKIIL